MKKESYENRMGELEACEEFGADSKEEAMESIQEEIGWCEARIRECEAEEETPVCSGYHLDPAFASWESAYAI